jgi:hypothetical protein
MYRRNGSEHMSRKLAAVNRVRNPAINARLPKDSAMMTKNATSQRSPIIPGAGKPLSTKPPQEFLSAMGRP